MAASPETGTVAEVIYDLAGRASHGRIAGDDGGTYFLHRLEVVHGPVSLFDRVTFVPGDDGRGPRARQVSLLAPYVPGSDDLQPIELVCHDCRASFVWTADEQRTHRLLRFAHRPVRCRACRQARRAARDWEAQ